MDFHSSKFHTEYKQEYKEQKINDLVNRKSQSQQVKLTHGQIFNDKEESIKWDLNGFLQEHVPSIVSLDHSLLCEFIVCDQKTGCTYTLLN